MIQETKVHLTFLAVVKQSEERGLDEAVKSNQTPIKSDTPAPIITAPAQNQQAETRITNGFSSNPNMETRGERVDSQSG